MSFPHDRPLVVENQLAPSDHGHLGQLLPYAAGTGAATIVWIVTLIRDEHRRVLRLNEQTGEDTHFFAWSSRSWQSGRPLHRSYLPAPDRLDLSGRVSAANNARSLRHCLSDRCLPPRSSNRQARAGRGVEGLDGLVQHLRGRGEAARPTCRAGSVTCPLRAGR